MFNLSLCLTVTLSVLLSLGSYFSRGGAYSLIVNCATINVGFRVRCSNVHACVCLSVLLFQRWHICCLNRLLFHSVTYVMMYVEYV